MTPLESAPSAAANPTASPGESPAAPVAQFSGALEDLSIADLIQILQLASKSAAIVLSHDGKESRLWCVAGEIVDAESGCLRGETAVHRILGIERGWLTADLRTPARTRCIFAGTQRLLLEAARRKDEAVALHKRLGHSQRCYRLARGRAPNQLGLSPVELSLLRSFAEARSVQEVLQSSELGDFETLTALSTWIDTGQLVAAGVRPAPLTPSEAPGQAAGTLRPLVASAPPRPRAPLRSSASIAWAAVVALVLTPLGYLLGNQTRHVPEAPSVLPAPTSLAAAPEAPDSYVVALRVDPPQAKIWLDRELAASGSLDTRLPKNGTPHELRVEARGYQPLNILFVDTPPPVELRLEPNPALERPAANPAGSHRAAPAPASDAAPVRKAPSSARTPVRPQPPRPSPNPNLRSRPRAALGGVREASARQRLASRANEPISRRLD